MRAIDKKLLRDMWHLKAQVLAILVVMACGVGTFVMSSGIYQSLLRMRTDYYRQHEFADLFVTLKRAPMWLAERIGDIQGVARWDARIVTLVRLQIEGLSEPAVGQLISLPLPGQTGLNRIYLRSGRLPQAAVATEAVVSESFARAHRLQLGDRIAATINGHGQSLSVVGIALSPEFIYEIPPGGLLPDNKTFGVLWMDHQSLAAAMDMTAAFNNLTLQLASPNYQATITSQIDQLTAEYGGLGAIDRSDQSSHKFIQNELNELRNMSLVAPSIFLSVAAFLLNIVLSRLIATQREQIAALKAFGYSNPEIAWHYLKMALASAILGASLGTVLGVYLGMGMAQMYSRFFNFPSFQFYLPPQVVLLAWSISCLCAALAVWAAVRHAMRLPPAEAMRPESPPNYSQTWMEKVGGWLFQSSISKMVLRQLARKPRRSILSIMGISLAIAVLVLGSFMQDAVDFLFDAMFRLSQRYDLNVVLVDAKTADTLNDFAQIPGVLLCEGYRSVPARIRLKHRQRLTAVTGYPDETDLVKLIDQRLQNVDIPTSGIMVSTELARILEARLGDYLTVELLEGRRQKLQLPLTATIDDFAGTSAYIKQNELCELLKEQTAISGAMLSIDPAAEAEVYARLKNMPAVAQVSITRATRDSFRRTVAENIRRLRFINLLFSCAISIGVVYSTARISFSERSRELATMRVLGFSKQEVAGMLIVELSILTIAAIPIGCVVGYCLAWLMIFAADPELFRLPLVVNLQTYVFASSVVLTATVLACTLLKWQIDRLDLVEVLKSKE